jgi:glutamate 5-kinase
MGMARDMRQRVTLARVDDDAKRRKVEIAHDIIYKQNYAVDSAAVEAILKEESLVPASVSSTLFAG